MPEILLEAQGREDIMSGEAMAVSLRIAPMLRGLHPAVQSAALADLVALHLAGIFILNDPDETAPLRQTMLDFFLESVKNLIPINEEKITKPMLDEALARGE